MPLLIKNVELVDIVVSEKTVWQHMVVYAGDHVGHGEYTLEGQIGAVRETAAEIADTLIGKQVDPALSGLFSQLCRRDQQGAAVVSAIDQASHDILARTADLPLLNYLGGAGVVDAVPLYANINRRTIDRSPQSFAESARKAVEHGFDAFKLAPFDGVTPENCGEREGRRLIDQALARIAAVAAALPHGAAIMVDCHWRLDRPTAVGLVPELAERGVCWYECPLREFDANVSDIVAVRRASNERGMRLAGCETMALWDGFRPYIENGAYDVVMPDIKYVGGYSALFEIVERAREHGTAVSMHNPSGPVCHLHSLHATAALGLGERLEVQFDESPLFDTITAPRPPHRSAMCRIPAGHGIGAQLIGDRQRAEYAST